MRLGRHELARAARARAAFLETHAPAEVARRNAEIQALPLVEWRGQLLRTIRCHGETGNGPHDMNVPEGLLWSLIDIRAFRCPFHA